MPLRLFFATYSLPNCDELIPSLQITFKMMWLYNVCPEGLPLSLIFHPWNLSPYVNLWLQTADNFNHALQPPNYLSWSPSKLIYDLTNSSVNPFVAFKLGISQLYTFYIMLYFSCNLILQTLCSVFIDHLYNCMTHFWMRNEILVCVSMIRTNKAGAEHITSLTVSHA